MLAAEEVLAAYASDPPGAVFHTSPLAVPVWKRHLDENSPGQKPSATPILVVQGGRDELVPAGVTSNWVRGRACAVGDTVTEKEYPEADHISVLTASRVDVDAWVADRVAGIPPPSECSG